MKLFRAFFLLFVMLLAACNARPIPTPTQQILPTNTIPPLPSLTPFGSISGASPTPLSFATVAQPATSIAPPTSFAPATAVAQSQSGPIANTRILTNGRGITTGAAMNDGNFEVEGYCALLNPTYGVSRDTNNWFCTYQEQQALILRQEHFDDICRRTYNSSTAIAYQIPNTGQPVFAWRCLEYTVLPTSTPVRIPVLAQNGRGMSSGSVMSNGNFEVEAYCSSINSSYGVTRDDNYWYCTQNNLKIITLGVAEFDDICIRTYNPAAYAEQIQSNEIPAFRWRCYVLQ